MDRRIETLFHTALDLTGPEREAFLRESCGADESLRAEVEALLEDAERGEALMGSAIGRMMESFEPAVGERIGAYELMERIGEGGMGVVFRARRADGVFDQDVAIKFVQGGAEVRARFRQEREILARLTHPFIARLLDGGVTADGTAYMVMEYFPGKPITEVCQEKAITRGERLRLFRQVCEAVEHAHRSLIIHRDLKPSNILMNAEGDLKLLDFGIAKLIEAKAGEVEMTVAGQHFFTPDYASPEQVHGAPVTTATDVYSLGVVLYELISGRRAHVLENYSPGEIMRVVCQQEPAPLGTGTELDAIARLALHKDPARRYPSVGHLAEDIGRFLAHQPVVAQPDSAAYRVRKFVERNHWAVAGGVVAVASLLIGSGVAIWQARIAREEARQAQHRFQQVRKLAGTMLFDLDAKIRTLTGSTEARELLAKTALQYLDGLYQDARQDAGLRGEVAAAYEKVGDVFGDSSRPNLGQPEDALRSYFKALSLHEQGGEDPRALARLYLKLHSMQGKPEILEKAARAAEQSVAAFPHDEVAEQLAIRVARAQATSFKNLSQYDRALAQTEKAVQLAAQSYERKKTEAAEQLLAQLYSDLSRTALRKGNARRALEAADRAAEIHLRRLAAMPNDPARKRAVMMAHMLRGDALGNPECIHLGRVGEALACYRSGLAIVEEMVAKDAKDALASGDAAYAKWAIGIAIAESNPRQARPLLEAALAGDEALLRRSPNAVGFLQNVANTQYALSGVLRLLGDKGEALELLRRAVGHHAAVTRQSKHRLFDLSQYYMRTLAKLAELELEVGQREAAVAAIERALQMAREIPKDEAYFSKLPDVAIVYQARTRLAQARGENPQPWIDEAKRIFSELEKSGAESAYLRLKRDQFAKAISGKPGLF